MMLCENIYCILTSNKFVEFSEKHSIVNQSQSDKNVHFGSRLKKRKSGEPEMEKRKTGGPRGKDHTTTLKGGNNEGDKNQT